MRNRGSDSGNGGSSLASILLFVTLLIVVAFGMATLFTTNLNFTNASSNAQFAMDEAEAGLSQVLINLAADPDYGTHQEQFRRTLNTEFGAESSYHEVSFDPGQTAIPYSTNARAGETTGYLGRVVPSETVHVIVTGYCRGQVRTLEAMVKQPPFNFALASAGPIQSGTPLRVEGLSARQDYLADGEASLPGHIASNSAQGISVAGVSGLSSFVSGEARSTGPVSMDPNAVVKLGIRPNNAPLDLPSVDIRSFDPSGTGGLNTITTSNSTLSSLSSAYRTTGDLTFSSTLALNQGLIYSPGNLVFSQGVSGVGAIIAEGDVTIRGADSQFSGSDTVAILAGGKVTIEGDSSNTVTPTSSFNFINGLVYAEKGVDLNNVTVAGVVLTKDANSNTQLANTNLIYSADAADLSITIAPSVDSGGGDLPPIFFGSVDSNGNFVAGDPAQPQAGQSYIVGLPVTNDPTVWTHQLSSPPGGGTFQDFLANKINDPNTPAVAGYLQDAGFDLSQSSEAARVIEGWNQDPNVHPTQEERNEQLAILLAGTQPASQTSWTITQPGGTFNLDLNTFLPRSATLKVTACVIHNRRL